jgi:mannitol-1-phosphate/altronate dehydrogenase
MTALPLRTRTLAHHSRRVSVPTYDRAALSPSVVHISVGSFHRSHQAMYFDEIAERRISSDWGIVGVGLHRPEMCDVLAAQDGLYTVVARSAAADQARVVGAIRRYLFAPEDDDNVVRSLADRRTRLVTLTLTGDGYRAGGAAIRYLVAALDRRRRAGLRGFTILSCDNMPGNGRVARSAVLLQARALDADLATWIEDSVAFPSSMVDRITPKTTPEDREWVERRFGVADGWPVVTEPFSQWIVEDEFCDARPPLDAVGVQFVGDVRPYSLMKTRLLNAGHCALGYLGYLSGHRRTDEAMSDPVLAGYLVRMLDEVTPLLPPVPGIDLSAYKHTLLERFANPKIGDRLGRLCRNGSTKMPTHVISSIREARERGLPHDLLTLAVAGWFRYLRGFDEDGASIALDDPLAERLRPLAIAGGTDPRPLLREAELFGDLADDGGFVDDLERALIAIEQRGAHAAAAGLGVEQGPLVA